MLKRLFRWLFRFLILAIVLVVALLLLKDTLIKALAEWRIRRETGLSVTIEKLEVGLFSPTFHMEGFKLYNPPDFGGSVFLDIPEVHFEYNAQEVAKGRVHLNLLRFNLRELHLVRNQSGQTNVTAIFAKATAKQAPAGKGGGSGMQPRVEFGGIDRLYLSLGTVKFTDMPQPKHNWQRTIGWKDYEVKSLKTAEDVQNWAALTVLQIMIQQRFSPGGAGIPAPR